MMKKGDPIGGNKVSPGKPLKAPPFDPSVSSKEDRVEFTEEDDEGDYESEDSDSEFERSSQAEDMEDYRLDGYHPVSLAETFKSGQYKVVQKLGWGHFSTVWLVNEVNTDKHFALKIQKSKKSYLEAAQDELEILKALNSAEKIQAWCASVEKMESEFTEKKLKAPLLKQVLLSKENYCVKLTDSFFHFGMHGKHQCSVFEIMGPNLLDLIQHFEFKNKFMDLKIVKAVSRQILLGLDYMHRICDVIHTDLKPENVMLQLEPGSYDYFINRMKEYKRKPKSMLFLKNLKQKLGNVSNNKNKKKYQKKKQKKQAKKQADSQNTELEKDTPKANEQALANPKGEGEPGIQSEPTVKKDPNDEANIQDDIIKFDEELTTPPDTKDAEVKTAAAETKVKREDPKKAEKPEKEEDLATLKWKETIHLKLDENIKIKIVDFGNGCWTNKHFTDNIQTREYRSPEAILGIDYQPNTDLWSFACMVFEMITNTFLFKPRSGESYSKNDDHLALMMETLGKMPKTFALSGKYSRDYFNKSGQLIRIKEIKEFTIKNILVKDFHFDEKIAADIEEFLRPMLEFDPKKRIDARTALMHPWLWE